MLANRNLEESYLDVKNRIYPVEQELKNVDRKLSEATSELRIIETQKRNEKMLIDAKTMESRFETFLEFSWAPDDVSNKGMHALIREVDPIVFDPDAILRSLISSGGEFSKLVQIDIGEKRIGAETCHPISHKVLIEIADDTVVNLKETAASLAQTHYLATNKSNPIQKGLGKRTTKIIDDTRKSKSESKAYFDVITNYELPLSAVSKYSSRCISEAYNVYSFHRDRVLKKTGIAHELVNINISDPSWIMFRRINGVQGEELSNSYQY